MTNKATLNKPLGNLTQNRLNKHTTLNGHNSIRMVNGRAVLDNPSYGTKTGFYFITDYRNKVINISLVGDDIGTKNRGFGHVISAINTQRSEPMQALHQLLKNKRTLRVSHLGYYTALEMVREYAESQYCKPISDGHARWMRTAFCAIDKDLLLNDFRPLMLIMKDIWL